MPRDIHNYLNIGVSALGCMPGTHRFSRIHEELTDFHKSQLQVLLRGMGFDVELTPAYATCKKLVDRPVIGIGLF